MPMNPLVLKLIGGLAAVCALMALVADRNRWKGKAVERQAEIARLCDATREAAGQPKLDCRRAEQQIRLLGQALRGVKAALEDQNARVAALGAESKRQQAAAAAAASRGAERARDAGRAVAGLEASARSSGRLERPCEPSEAVRERWR